MFEVIRHLEGLVASARRDVGQAYTTMRRIEGSQQDV